MENRNTCRVCSGTKIVGEITYLGKSRDGLIEGQRIVTHERFIKTVYMSFGFQLTSDPAKIWGYYSNEDFKTAINNYRTRAMRCPSCDSGETYAEIQGRYEQQNDNVVRFKAGNQ